MNKTFENKQNKTAGMDDVGRLIHLAGAREAVPDERFERARHNVYEHWQQVVAEQQTGKRSQLFRSIAIAASLIVVAGLSIFFWNQPQIPRLQTLASVERVIGDVQIADNTALTGNSIGADTPVVTGKDGRIALRMNGGRSLRLDTASHVIIHSPDHVSLKTGAIYIATSPLATDHPILVTTPFGSARDIGTQFQVRLGDASMVVGVRQGLVEVTRTGQTSHAVEKGYVIELGDSTKPEKRPMTSSDPGWDWIETIAPEFDIQGKSLEQYLYWFAGESGVSLQWADAASQARANSSMLSGSIAGATLEESLVIVQQVAPFDYRHSDDSLWVKVR